MEDKIRKVLDEVKKQINERTSRLIGADASPEALERMKAELNNLLSTVQTEETTSEREYRLEVLLPRGLNQKLEQLKRDIWEEKGRRVSKSRLVVEILSDFFEKA